MNIPSLQALAQQTSCMDDYDPNSLPVPQARQLIRQYLHPVQAQESLAIRDTLGRIVAQDIICPVNVPQHNNSAMDGYAYCADEPHQANPIQRTCIGTAFAGTPFAGEIKSGECVRIMTGAVIPQGADTVVMQEHTSADANHITIHTPPTKGANIRKAGDDLRQGHCVLAKGHLIKPADLGLLASLGFVEIRAFRQLRVAFFSTGDELVNVGKPLAEGQIYDSNRYTLYGMLTRLGVDILDLGAIPDTPSLLEAALLSAANSADVVITSGGVSVGEADYMKQLLSQHGQVLFWKLAMKPGRPLAYGKIGNAHYFGLPGNPVATMVTFYQFVRDALYILMGQSNPPQHPILKAECTQAIKKMAGRTEFIRAKLSADEAGVWKVSPTGNQSSGVLSSMSEANCFIILDITTSNVPAHSMVDVQLFDGIV